MKWVEREQWCEAFADLLDRHLDRACGSANIEPEDLTTLIDDQDFGTLWGCAFEDFLSRDLDDGRRLLILVGSLPPDSFRTTA
jgi:hypothetical protein